MSAEQPAASGRLVVNVDGGARGNPGPAAVAVVISTPDGDVLEKRGERIGHSRGAREVELVCDPELVVRQVSGEYKVKDEVLHRLHKQVIRALAELDSWSIRHVHREENAAADDLVNAALDA